MYLSTREKVEERWTSSSLNKKDHLLGTTCPATGSRTFEHLTTRKMQEESGSFPLLKDFVLQLQYGFLPDTNLGLIFFLEAVVNRRTKMVRYASDGFSPWRFPTKCKGALSHTQLFSVLIPQEVLPRHVLRNTIGGRTEHLSVVSQHRKNAASRGTLYNPKTCSSHRWAFLFLVKGLSLVCPLIFFFFGCAVQHAESQSSNQGSALCPCPGRASPTACQGRPSHQFPTRRLVQCRKKERSLS